MADANTTMTITQASYNLSLTAIQIGLPALITGLIGFYYLRYNNKKNAENEQLKYNRDFEKEDYNIKVKILLEVDELIANYFIVSFNLISTWNSLAFEVEERSDSTFSKKENALYIKADNEFIEENNRAALATSKLCLLDLTNVQNLVFELGKEIMNFRNSELAEKGILPNREEIIKMADKMKVIKLKYYEEMKKGFEELKTNKIC